MSFRWYHGGGLILVGLLMLLRIGPHGWAVYHILKAVILWGH